MKTFAVCVVFCGAVLIGSNAQVPVFGTCGEQPVVDKFKLADYMGTWFEQEKYPNVFQLGGKCLSATYEHLEGNKISVFNKQINRFTGNENAIRGVGELTEPGKFEITLPSSEGSSPLWVLDTDYKNYAVVYSCTSASRFISLRTVWILTRAQVPEQKYLDMAHKALDERSISRIYLLKTDHTDCSAGQSARAFDPETVGDYHL